MNDNKIPCSGIHCSLNRNFKCEECQLYDECALYTPKKYICGKCGDKLQIDSIGFYCTRCGSYYDKYAKIEGCVVRYKNDVSELDAVLEMTEKEFKIADDKQKKKLRILFDAYAAYKSKGGF